MNVIIKSAAFFGSVALLIGVFAGSGSGSRASLGPDIKTPSDQTKFAAAVASARAQYRSAANELAAGGIRSSRQQAICDAVINQAASDWVGKISRLTTNGDGKGVIGISIGPNVQIATWNNRMSDIGDRTLIEPDSSVFKTLAKMKVGDTVKFSGRFTPSRTDCVGEQSFTLQGSMTDPAFTMRFTYIQKLS